MHSHEHALVFDDKYDYVWIIYSWYNHMFIWILPCLPLCHDLFHYLGWYDMRCLDRWMLGLVNEHDRWMLGLVDEHDRWMIGSGWNAMLYA